MRAVYFADKTVTVVQRPQPQPQAGEALLKVRLAGICNTDVELFSGYYGFAGIPGHEFVAEVVSAPDAPEWEGRRVVADINFACRQCPVCAAGRKRHCPNRTVLGIVNQDGAFAEYCLAPVDNLVEVPKQLPDDKAVFAEPLAAGLEVGQQVHITGQDTLLVIGDGKLGLLTALGLRHLCPGLILVGKHQDKLEIAAVQGVRTERVQDSQELAQLTGKYGLFDLVVEASGRSDTLQQALGLVRPEGCIVAKTTSHERTSIDLAALVVNEITLVGSRCGDIALAVDYLANGWVDPTPLVEACLPFAEFEQAFALARRPGSRKILISF